MKGSMASMRSSGATAALAEGSLRLGDELLVQAGDFVPADLRLVEARGLAVDEWELTGEIAPVEKRLNGEGEMRLYRGSRVTRGSGKGVVLAIGAKTEYQDIVEQARERACRPFPPLVRARYLALLVLLAPPVATTGCDGRKARRCSATQIGPTPGPPPPWGMAKVLWRLRWQTSAPM